MKLHKHSDDPNGCPCMHMEPLLQAAADGSAKGLGKWYAEAHAERCDRCSNYLARTKETIAELRAVREAEPTPDVVERLAKGEWRQEAEAKHS